MVAAVRAGLHHPRPYHSFFGTLVPAGIMVATAEFMFQARRKSFSWLVRGHS